MALTLSPVRAVQQVFGGRVDDVWQSAEHVHIEVAGVDQAATGAAVTQAVAALPGVAWAAANPRLGRLIVALDRSADVLADVTDLRAAIRDARTSGAFDTGLPAPDHPGDAAPVIREAVIAIADVVALAVSGVGRLVPIPRLPAEIAGLVPVVSGNPRLRHPLERVFGETPTHVGLSLVGATANALTRSPLGLLSDLSHRVVRWADAVDRRRCWSEVEPRLCSTAETAAAEPAAASDRPVPLPNGPVERHAERVSIWPFAGAAGVGIATRDVRRGSAALMAATPRAATVGRDVLGAHVGRALAARRCLVLEPRALRRLDRIDCVVLDATDMANGTSLRDELVDDAPAVVAAARAAGHMIVVAGDDAELERRLGADLRVDAGEALASSIRQLQTDGCVVLLISRVDGAAPLAADVAVGVPGDGAVPWAADVLIPDLASAAFIVQATNSAGEVSRQSATIAACGLALAELLAMTAPVPLAAARAMDVVHLATLAAQVNALRVAVELNHRAVPGDDDAVAGEPGPVELVPADVPRLDGRRQGR